MSELRTHERAQRRTRLHVFARLVPLPGASAMKCDFCDKPATHAAPNVEMYWSGDSSALEPVGVLLLCDDHLSEAPRGGDRAGEREGEPIVRRLEFDWHWQHATLVKWNEALSRIFEAAGAPRVVDDSETCVQFVIDKLKGASGG